MPKSSHAQVVLENGRGFRGRSIAAPGQVSGDVLIVSEYADYQGILCDPASAGRIVLMTYPHIGNTGWQKSDRPITAAAVLMAWYEDFKGDGGQTLAEALTEAGVPAVADLDTRAMARAIMDLGLRHIELSTDCGLKNLALSTEESLTLDQPLPSSRTEDIWLGAGQMPPLPPAAGRRTDLKKILIIGSGPIVIGQACEFDYSGVQATKTLKAAGYEVILINSNPATIMTDPELADRTYIEPLKPEYVEAVIAKERPQALLATMGGQTALNMAMVLAENGVLEKYQVELIGADYQTIKRAENRDSFRETVTKAGLGIPKSGMATNLDEAKKLAGEIGYPIIVRPSFTLGGPAAGWPGTRRIWWPSSSRAWA